MNLTLPADLERAVEQEVLAGAFESSGALVEEVLRTFLAERAWAQERLECIRRIGEAVGQAGFYDRVPSPEQ